EVALVFPDSSSGPNPIGDVMREPYSSLLRRWIRSQLMTRRIPLTDPQPGIKRRRQKEPDTGANPEKTRIQGNTRTDSFAANHPSPDQT
ncbi:MAG: hypothetical protein AAF550_13995, partial [Myxococcota bacterium]